MSDTKSKYHGMTDEEKKYKAYTEKDFLTYYDFKGIEMMVGKLKGYLFADTDRDIIGAARLVPFMGNPSYDLSIEKGKTIIIPMDKYQIIDTNKHRLEYDFRRYGNGLLANKIIFEFTKAIDITKLDVVFYLCGHNGSLNKLKLIKLNEMTYQTDDKIFYNLCASLYAQQLFFTYEDNQSMNPYENIKISANMIIDLDDDDGIKTNKLVRMKSELTLTELENLY
jgi:hypothetical protein